MMNVQRHLSSCLMMLEPRDAAAKIVPASIFGSDEYMALSPGLADQVYALALREFALVRARVGTNEVAVEFLLGGPVANAAGFLDGCSQIINTTVADCAARSTEKVHRSAIEAEADGMFHRLGEIVRFRQFMRNYVERRPQKGKRALLLLIHHEDRNADLPSI